MSIRFDDRVAIVTGAGGGLGRQYALELARRGAKVVVNDLGGDRTGTGHSDAALKVVEEIEAAGGQAMSNGGSVADYEQMAEMVARAKEKWGGVHILINNAGVLRDKTFAKMEPADFEFVIKVHLIGSAFATKACWGCCWRTEIVFCTRAITLTFLEFMKAAYFSNAFVRFMIKAAVLYLLCFLIHQFFVRRHTFYDQKFIGHLIEATDFLLRALGFTTFKILQDLDVQVLGIDGSNGVWVGSNCNAISLFYLFAVFVIAYPGSAATKAWFIPAGIIAIHLLNIARVAVLALVAKYSPESLNFNHTYTFTFLVYAFIFFLWMLWVNRFSDPPQSPSA